MSTLANIDLKDPNMDIDIINISWDEFSTIMKALNTMIKKLEKENDDNYLNQERLKVLKKYKDLFDKLEQGYSPWRGQAESIEDQVIRTL